MKVYIVAVIDALVVELRFCIIQVGILRWVGQRTD